MQQSLVLAMSKYISSLYYTKSYTTRAVCHKKPCLSPVRTQNLMPASSSCAMVWGTPSCSLSLIAVAPISCMFCSSSAYSASNNSSRFSSEMLFTTVCHFSTSRRAADLKISYSDLYSCKFSFILVLNKTKKLSWWCDNMQCTVPIHAVVNHVTVLHHSLKKRQSSNLLMTWLHGGAASNQETTQDWPLSQHSREFAGLGQQTSAHITCTPLQWPFASSLAAKDFLYSSTFQL